MALEKLNLAREITRRTRVEEYEWLVERVIDERTERVLGPDAFDKVADAIVYSANCSPDEGFNLPFSDEVFGAIACRVEALWPGSRKRLSAKTKTQINHLLGLCVETNVLEENGPYMYRVTSVSLRKSLLRILAEYDSQAEA